MPIYCDGGAVEKKGLRVWGPTFTNLVGRIIESDAEERGVLPVGDFIHGSKVNFM